LFKLKTVVLVFDKVRYSLP